MNSTTISDPSHHPGQFHRLLDRQRDAVREIHAGLTDSDDATLIGLRGQTQTLLTEVARLITIAPPELHSRFGVEVFEYLHQEVATAVTVSTSAPLAAAGAGWHRERLSTSLELAVYILDLLSGEPKPRALRAWSEKVERKHAAEFPLTEQLSAADADEASALYVANAGTTRL